VKRVVGIAAVCAVWVTAAGASGASGPTLFASAHVAGVPAVVFGSSIALGGHESAGGSQLAVLQADVWPFSAGYVNVASSKTTGNYSFNVAPAHATRYRVMVGTAASPVATVYVLARKVRNTCNLCRQGNAAGTHTLTVTETDQAPAGRLAVPGTEYFYYGQTNGSNAKPKTLSLVKTVTLHIHAGTLSYSASYTVHFPTTAFEFAYATCFKDAESKDGLGLPGHHRCGNNTIARGGYLG
jgi:hypothetical protein